MKKILRKNKLLLTFLAFAMALTAFFAMTFGFGAKNVSAEEASTCSLTEEFQFPAYEDFDESEYVENSPVAGKYIRIKLPAELDVLTGDFAFCSFGSPNCTFGVNGYEQLSEIWGAPYVYREAELALDFYFPEGLILHEPFFFDATTAGFYEIRSDNVELKLLTLKDVDVMPDAPEAGNDNVNGGDVVKDWFNAASDDVQDWVGQNLGFAVSGSAVLIIGGIIILYILFKRKK